MSSESRLWQHHNLWRIQDYRQITDRDGVPQDAWESRRDEHGHVMMFKTEDQAREYLQSRGETSEAPTNETPTR